MKLKESIGARIKYAEGRGAKPSRRGEVNNEEEDDVYNKREEVRPKKGPGKD